MSRIDYCHPEEGIALPSCGGSDAGSMITCGPGTVLQGTECVSAGDDGGDDAADAGDDGPPASTCQGQCVTSAPVDWWGPVFLQLDPPPSSTCPEVALSSSMTGFTELDASAPCPPCLCDPPVGSCDLPASIAASPARCEADADAGQIAFEPPDGWDGGCVANAGAGGTGDAGASITIAPLVVDETSCTPHPAAAGLPPATQTSALVCHGTAYGTCPSSAEVCAPAPEGFVTCVSQQGDADCDAPWMPPYTQKYTFYEAPSDQRKCSACTCGPPTGSLCSAQVSIYPDGACAAPPSNTNVVDSTKPVCVDLAADTVLGSASASAPTYAPGSCQPDGGVLSGADLPANPITFCCISPSPPPRGASAGAGP